MDEYLEELKRQRAVRLLVPLFFVSGLTALVYQTIWARQLQLIFGTSQFAIATVLAAFMAGLAAGGFLMARYADRAQRPLLIYGALEIFIGLYALVFPKLLDAATPLYLGFYEAASPTPLVFAVFQFLVIGVLLLAPTTCMGATLPLLGRFVTGRVGAAGDRIGMLYGVNTFGAVVGIGIAGFFLLPALGLAATTAMAAVANVALGSAAIALSRWHGEGQVPHIERDIETEPSLSLRPVLLVAVLTGFAALVYEVSWFRLMGLVLGGSTYAFSVMLLAFLTGIAGGGWAGGPIADRLLQRRGPGGPLLGLAIVQAGIAALTWLMMHLYEDLPFLFLALFDSAERYDASMFPFKIGLAALVMTPPALLMGASFPLMVRAVVGGSDGALGRPVGQVYGANTLGSIAGAFAGGFLLLPQLNIVGTVLSANGANIAAALVAYTAAMHAARKVSRSAQAAWTVTGVAVLWLAAMFPPSWNPLLMTSGVYKYASELSDRSRSGLMAFAVDDYQLLFYDEGLSTVVTVAQSKVSGNIWLANNGKVDASTTVDMPTQVLVSHLPFLFADEPTSAVVIGLASGITLGSVTLYEELEEIQVVELEPSIVEASHYFDDYNHRPLEDPRVEMVANDGRNHLLLQPPERYDVIVAEPSNPWLTGVSNLFTRDFWVMGRERLKPGGVWSQWVQLYGMSPDDLRSLLATFADVFPHVLLFATIEDADLVLLGSEDPLVLSVEGARRLLDDHAGVAAELRLVGIKRPHDVLTFYQFGREEILEVAGDVEFNTDDNMRVEYSAPRHLHSETSQENFLLLLPKSRSAEIDGVEDNILLAEAYGRRGENVRALVCLKRITDVDPEHEEAVALTRKYAEKLAEELGEL
ncbi:MAG TPA: fused MFS/spermidine synthase [Myxococcota bacterium]|nr:fused MFS/spermidine synthase [Myxococcota bacterium]